MKKEIIELAIRSPKKGVNQSDFETAKNAAVKKLVSLRGIGPERVSLNRLAPFQKKTERSMLA
jgi:hypothetical protein